MASESFSKVPASTISWQRRSYSSAEPSHQWTESGSVSAAISSTQLSSLACLVGAWAVAMSLLLTGRITLLS